MSVKNPIRFTIGTKISLLFATLLVCSVVALMWVSTRLFIDDNTNLIQQLNAESAASHAVQAREVLERMSEKLLFVGQLLLAGDATAPDRARLIGDVYSRDADLAAILVYDHTGAPEGKLKSASVSPQIAADPGGKSMASAVAELRDFSLAHAAQGEAQVGRLKLPDGTSAVALGIPFVRNDKGEGFTHTVVGVTRQTHLHRIVGQNDLVTTFLVDRKGNCLAHADTAVGEAGENLSYLAIVSELLQGKFHNGQTRYVDSHTGEARLGAYRAVGFAGLGVVAEVPEAKASEAANWVQYRSMLLAVIVLCVSVLVGHLFSDTITSPIYDLVRAATKIAKGDFQINLRPKSQDEVGYLSTSFNAMAKGLEERDKVKKMFQKFHSKEVTDKLLSGEVKLGGERKQAVIFFSDIRGFTKLAESMPPDAVVELLNEYLKRMVPVILEYKGVVDKFIGDAIMAMWGVPLARKDDVENAVWACLAMREELADLNEARKKRGAPVLNIGMGLHVGEVTAGNIGSDERMEYTVIGDTVNLASRIESATKVQGTDLLVEKSVREKVKDKFLFEACPPLVVKGKSAPVELFKVTGYLDEKKKPVIVKTPYSEYEAESSDKVAA